MKLVSSNAGSPPAVDFSKSVFEKGFSLAGSTLERSANFSSMKVGRIAAFDQTSFGADVNATQLEVTGVFTAREAHFNSRTGSVDFTSLKTGGDGFFTRATFAGPVTFQSAHVAENWRLDGSLFTNANAVVKFEEVKVGAATTFVECRFAGYVSFKDARFAALDFSKVTWPTAREHHTWLWLNGMTYGRISAGSEKDSWQNLYNLVQRTAHGSAYSADIFTRLEDYYRKLGYLATGQQFLSRAEKTRTRRSLAGLRLGLEFFSRPICGLRSQPRTRHLLERRHHRDRLPDVSAPAHGTAKVRIHGS